MEVYAVPYINFVVLLILREAVKSSVSWSRLQLIKFQQPAINFKQLRD